MPDLDALGPAPRGERELEVVAPVGLVLDGGDERGLEEPVVAEDVLGDAEAQAEEGRAAEHVVVRVDVERRPAVDHGEDGEVVVGPLGGVRRRAEGEGAQDGRLEELFPPRVAGSKDLLPRREEAVAETGQVALEHELVQVGHAAGVLRDLLPRLRVQDRQTGVDVPLGRVDPDGQVDLDVLDAADVAAHHPGELAVRVPGLAHRQEGGMGHSLRVRGDAVVLLGAEVDKVGLEAGEHGLDLADGRVRSAVLNDDQGLVLGIDTGAVEGMAGDDVDVRGEMSLESGNLGGFTRCLSSDNRSKLGCYWQKRMSEPQGSRKDGTRLDAESKKYNKTKTICTGEVRWHTWCVILNHFLDDGSLNAVDDVVARAGDIMSILADLYVFLKEGRKSFSTSRVSFSGSGMGLGGIVCKGAGPVPFRQTLASDFRTSPPCRRPAPCSGRQFVRLGIKG